MAKGDIKYTKSQIERLINDVYNGKVTPEQLPEDLYRAIVKVLADAIFEGYGQDFSSTKIVTRDRNILNHFLRNSAIFSAAKTHQQINDMSKFLFDANGVKIPFAEFETQATEVFDLYNRTWLETEYNTAISQAQGAEQWNNIQDEKDIFPLVKYTTVGDSRVRPEHRRWDGIVLPVDHPFWNTHTPPNDFNCRCILEQLEAGDEPITKLTKDQKTKPPTLFANNPAKDLVVFDPRHPYFKVERRYRALKKKDFDLPVPPNPSNPRSAPNVVKRGRNAILSV